jgi:hypothetical protein
MRCFPRFQITKFLYFGLSIVICWISAPFNLADEPTQMDVDQSLPPVRGLIEAFTSDLNVVKRFHPWSMSDKRHGRLKQLIKESSASLDAIDFQQLSQEERIDYLLLRNQLKFESRQIDQSRDRYSEIKDWLPFGGEILALAEARQRVEPMNLRTLQRSCMI